MKERPEFEGQMIFKGDYNAKDRTNNDEQRTCIPCRISEIISLQVENGINIIRALVNNENQ